VRSKGRLTVSDIDNGTQLPIRAVQSQEFDVEIKALRSEQSLPSRSAMMSLNPYLEKFRLIRVVGRLENSELDCDAMHPIFLTLFKLSPSQGPTHVLGRDRLIPIHSHMVESSWSDLPLVVSSSFFPSNYSDFLLYVIIKLSYSVRWPN